MGCIGGKDCSCSKCSSKTMDKDKALMIVKQLFRLVPTSDLVWLGGPAGAIFKALGGQITGFVDKIWDEADFAFQLAKLQEDYLFPGDIDEYYRQVEILELSKEMYLKAKKYGKIWKITGNDEVSMIVNLVDLLYPMYKKDMSRTEFRKKVTDAYGSSCDCQQDDSATLPDDDTPPIRYDPLALDLNHNGKIDTTSINGSDAYFDIDGNDGGIREHMGWLGAGDGFLVQDLNGNGKVDGISELFGSYTVNAFDDLKNRIDSNGDGIIDAKDDLFNTLQVWIDSNGNGVTDEGELHSLASLGITSIDTNKEIHTIWDGTRNVVNSTSSFTQNGEEQLAPSL